MLSSVVSRIFPSQSDRTLSKVSKILPLVASHEQELSRLSDDELAAVALGLREEVQGGAVLDDVKDLAFALVREAARRSHGMRPYDVQILGGAVMHEGMIAEMRTGEGKTLVALLPAFLNSLSGKGVHVITVNDYLARRDSQFAGQVLSYLGTTVSCIFPEMAEGERALAYASDITYGTNSEFGFDYLRDNMKLSREHMVQRPFNFVIIDEVDSVLIDEARTPLVISGPGPDMRASVQFANFLVSQLSEGDWDLDTRTKGISLSDAGLKKVEALMAHNGLLGNGGHLHDTEHMPLVPFVYAALRAHVTLEKDKDYLIHEDKILIVDANTGRTMDGRRFNDGLHQALEAKEGLPILPENLTVASITYQNFFRLYPKMCGMTGTAMTDADEFADIYALNVVVIPPHRPLARKDVDDAVYMSSAERDDAVVTLVRGAHADRQPVLVGTNSIEHSEALSRLFNTAGIPHTVLNARVHKMEAGIIAQAGRSGAVTIATNMAGRGTDIKLGGNLEDMLQEFVTETTTEEELLQLASQLEPQIKNDAEVVRKAGGLMVIGAGRNDSRRVDDQLRGRSGRQGDPGLSCFLVSLEDDLMQRFGGDGMKRMLKNIGIVEGQPLSHPMISRTVASAQKKLEDQHYDIRKNLIKYDDVINQQRKAFYERRAHLMDCGDEIINIVRENQEQLLEEVINKALPAKTYAEEWKAEDLAQPLSDLFNIQIPAAEWFTEQDITPEIVFDRALGLIRDYGAGLYDGIPNSAIASFQRQIVLQTLDAGWKEYLAELDVLRDGIGLRSYAQKNPLYEWQTDSARLFASLFELVWRNVVANLSKLKLSATAPESEQTAEGEADMET